MKNLSVLLLAIAFAGGACGKASEPATGDDTSKKPPASQPASQPGAKLPTPGAADLPAPDDVAAPPADAQKTASGLASKVLAPGTGTEHPAEQDSVTVHYTGWTTDGKMFDSSVKRGSPATFPLTGVIKGWTEGVQLMVVGEKRRFWIPAELAYGDRPGKPKGMLVFDIELLSIKTGPKPIPPPADLTSPPKNAKTTASGVVYEELKPGTGQDHPKDTSVIKMDYTGWSEDGKMVDSSVARGQPVSLPMKNAPAGFSDVLKVMVAGQKVRIWIPEKMIRKGPPPDPKKPDVKLVFDIEMLSILNLDAPADVAAAPANAEKTASGIASQVLTKGTGTEHPTATSRVKVNYTGWTTDGKMFDSSVSRGQPAEFPLSGVIAGWTEGVQLMVVGEKRRFWIPAKLAYEGKEGPQGLLVFDIELLEIKK